MFCLRFSLLNILKSDLRIISTQIIMIVKSLTTCTFDEIMDVFLKSFESYFVPMPTDPEYYRTRWQAAKVDYRLSYGMFDGNKLVGFILHGVDFRYGKKMAYNAGTGVLPDYRGQKIVNSIYQFALDDLRKNGIEKSVLEVITNNNFAIKAYQSVGFTIDRTLKCYKGKLRLQPVQNFKVIEGNFAKLLNKDLPDQSVYSWDNDFDSIKNGDYRYFEVHSPAGRESYFIINRALNYIAQFDLLTDDTSAWSRLFAGIQSITKRIKIYNIDDRLLDKIKVLEMLRLENVIDQYEMSLNLTDL